MITLIRHIAIAIPLILLQWLVLGDLRVYDAMADVLLLYVAWLAFTQGRQAGTIGGFLMGFVYDAIFGTWGIHMFLKTFLGFVIGTFHEADRDAFRIQPRQGFLGSLMIALLHNGLEIIFLAFQEGSTNAWMIGALWLGSALYTAVLATIIVLFSTR